MKNIYATPEVLQAMFLNGMCGQPMGIAPSALANVVRRRPKPATSPRREPQPKRQSTSTTNDPPSSTELRRRWYAVLSARAPAWYG